MEELEETDTTCEEKTKDLPKGKNEASMESTRGRRIAGTRISHLRMKKGAR
jgi:hypothetical protein